ncbi:MAG: CAP domain-containing protein [Blautia sp.]|nr:CAP domain-containing protein [Blautia sp.]
MKKIKFVSVLLAFVLLFTSTGTTVVQAAQVRPADVEKASSGNVLLGVLGKYERVKKATILKRLNKIRKEACEKGYRNPATGKTLKSSDYVEIKWSSDLESIAQLRAAECTVNEDHERPNGQTCFSISYNDETSWAECLAWNYSGLMAGIEQWYGEKNDWVKQNGNAVTGHYEALINPNLKYVGMGSFIRTSGGWYGVSAEFSFKDELDESQSDLKGSVIQTIEVNAKNVGKVRLNAPSSVKKGKSQNLTVLRTISFPGIMGGTNKTNGRYLGKVTWTSSKPGVLSVNSKGKIIAKKAGKATITAELSSGTTIKKTITVK